MVKLLRSGAIALLVVGANVAADECYVDSTPIVEMLNEYSALYGTSFVIDPRVRANVTIVAKDEIQLDADTLIRILRIHGFAAFDSGSTIYVVPEPVGQAIGAELGTPWTG